MKTHIALTFDKNYLTRAVALRGSLYEFSPESVVWFLCLDKECCDTAKKLGLKNTEILNLQDINDKELEAVFGTRTSAEFAMGSKGSLLLFIMNSGKLKPEDQLIFVDADMYFYSNPQAVFEKAYKGGSITITAHKFPKNREHLGAIRGIYNSGMIFFRNDPNARECIEEWRKQCIECCNLSYKPGNSQDQLYLNAWPKKYKNVYELPDKGVNTGTWNIRRFEIRQKDGKFTVDREPLVCFHLHLLKMYLDRGKIKPYPITVWHSAIYKIYMDAINEAYQKITDVEPNWNCGFASKPSLLRLLKQKIHRRFKFKD